MRYVQGFFRFWYDFIVGDDWKVAGAVVVALGIGALAVVAGAGHSGWFAPLLALAVAAAFAVALLIDVGVLRPTRIRPTRIRRGSD